MLFLVVFYQNFLTQKMLVINNRAVEKNRFQQNNKIGDGAFFVFRSFSTVLIEIYFLKRVTFKLISVVYDYCLNFGVFVDIIEGTNKFYEI